VRYRRKRLSLCLAAGVDARPGLLGDLDAHAANLRVLPENAIAQREPQALNRRMTLFASDPVHEILERFAGQHAGGVSLAKRRRKVSSKRTAIVRSCGSSRSPRRMIRRRRSCDSP
jgi:hypothetical protein